MCLVQDQNYLTRQQGVTRFADIMANDPLRKSKGNSLRSMYSVNKEFSQLASSFLYQVSFPPATCASKAAADVPFF